MAVSLKDFAAMPLSKIKMNGETGRVLNTSGMADYSRLSQMAVSVPDMAYHGRSDLTDEWAGADWKTTVKRAAVGNQKLVSKSDKFLSHFEDMVSMPTSAWGTVNAVAGGAPNVGAFLAGSPVNMRRRVRTTAEVAPIGIMFNGFFSAGVNHETIARRGAAAMALVRLLSASRPVTLYWFVAARDGKGSVITVPLDTAPLDLARASWMLQSPEAFRVMHFPLHRALIGTTDETSINWLGGHSWQSSEQGFRECARIVGATVGVTETIAVPPVLLGTTFKSDEAAIEWVRAAASKVLGLQDAA